MEVIADLHVHSRFSRATSKDLTIANLEKWAKVKGVDLLGTGDFQHPEWRKEIREMLKEDGKGILWSGTGFPFIWQTEISLMFSQGGKRRAIHFVVLAPNEIAADRIIEYLGRKGRLDYDGRPIFGIVAEDFTRDLKAIDEMIEMIPAHCLLPDENVICNPKPKKISSISIGDKVLTHEGIYQKVIKNYSRDFIGKAYNIKPYYFREGTKVTGEHPFLAIKTVKNCSYIRGLCKPNSTAKGKHKCNKQHYLSYKPEWISAENLEINDILLYPRQKTTQDIDSIKISDTIGLSDFRIKNGLIYPLQGRQNKGILDNVSIDKDFCRLAGYYLAEGYTNHRNNCVQFSFGKHETEYIEDVIKLMKKCFGIDITKKRDRNGYELYFFSKSLVRFFERLFYEKDAPLRAFSKKIPEFMIYLPIDKQAELFKGWWRGDAGVTVSEILAMQMKLICLRLGIIPSIYLQSKEYHNSRNSKIGERKIAASHDAILFHNLSFYENNFELLNDSPFKKFKTKLQRKHGWMDKNYAYIPIKEIETFDYKGPVYNLEVEDNHSYVTAAATVHNCMTPWFGLFGSKSGFDSLQECFGKQTGKIYAVESGMSADPAMLWRLKENANIVSFSDLHSFWPWRIGREATIFEMEELSYNGLIKAIRTGEGLKATIETPPEYGKYHWDGHRACNFSCSPAETKKLGGICPVCKKPLTIGVDYRIEEMAKEKAGYAPENARRFYKLVPLHELIAFLHETTLASKKTWEIYNKMIEKFGDEYNILLNMGAGELASFDEKLAELIIKNREGKIKVKPGYDGEYGQLVIEEQKKLF